MKTLNYPASLIMGLCMLLCGVSAQAAVSVTPSVAAGASSDVVFARLNFDIGTDYPFTSFGITMEYDPTKLAFDQELTVVKLGVVPYSFSEFMELLGRKKILLVPYPDPLNGIYGLSAIVANPEPVSGPLEVGIALRLLPEFTAGITQVTYFGDISGDGDELFFDGAFTVSAVPEPQTWLLWLGGLGLVLMQQARQRKLV